MVAMGPQLTHFAINTDDVEATQSFYAAIFGWAFNDYGAGFVQIIDEATQRPMGSIQQRRQLLDDTPTTGFECTFGVDDVEATRAQVVAAGGRILMEKSTIPGVGHLLAFEDPGGNPVLAMQYESSAE